MAMNKIQILEYIGKFKKYEFKHHEVGCFFEEMEPENKKCACSDTKLLEVANSLIDYIEKELRKE